MVGSLAYLQILDLGGIDVQRQTLPNSGKKLITAVKSFTVETPWREKPAASFSPHIIERWAALTFLINSQKELQQFVFLIYHLLQHFINPLVTF
jgi:hypothetical protein